MIGTLRTLRTLRSLRSLGSLGSLGSLKDLRTVGGGGYNVVREGGLFILLNKLNGVKVIKDIRVIRGFKVVKVLKISGQIIPYKDTYNILLYHLKMTRNALHSVSRMKK